MLPTALIFSNVCISKNHGTGIILERHLSNYDQEKMVNIYCSKESTPSFKNSFHVVRNGSPPRRLIRKAMSFIYQRSIPIEMEEVRKWMDKNEFSPQVIYASAYSLSGLEILSQILENFNFKLPVIQHFYDYIPDDPQRFEHQLKALDPYLSEIWAITPSLAEEVARITGREVRVVIPFCFDIPPVYKQTYNEFSSSFSAIMVGNVWLPHLLEDISAAWDWVSKSVGGIAPIKWFSHPASIERLRKLGIKESPHIQYCGFIPAEEKEFKDQLCNADIAIIPFNKQANPENDYAKYSLPSRITEMACAGLPMFVAAGANTDTARFVEKTGIGVCAAPSNEAHFRETLLSFIKDRELRSRCGQQARQLAETEFDIKQYQNFLYSKLAEVAQASTKF